MDDVKETKEKTIGMYADKRQYAILRAMQSKRAITALIATYLKTHDETDKFSWGYAKKFAAEIKEKANPKEFAFSDGTYRGAMLKWEKTGFVEFEWTDPSKKDYRTTTDGDRFCEGLLKLMFSS